MFCIIEGDEYSVYYEYDKNGNLVKDLNKNISSIQYNCLNLPSQIDIASLGIHEFKGHGLLKIGNNQHWRILQLQRDHYSWNNVSTKLKALYRYFETNKISNYNKE